MKKTYRTGARKEIYSYAKNVSVHTFSASQILGYFRENNISISDATVYRNLDRMVEEGSLIRYNTSRNESTYQYVDSEDLCHEHIHLKCKVCEKIIHLEGDLMEKVKSNLIKRYGFSVECDGSVILGVCRECKDKIS